MKGLIEVVESRQLNTYDVFNHKGDYLGFISFNNKWKRFVFNPDKDTFYDSKCLVQIANELTLIHNRKNKGDLK
jgi:hypothetical protein